MAFGFGAYVLALLCVIVSTLSLAAFFFKAPRKWISFVCRGCIYLFNQLHSNTFLANAIEEPVVLLARLERGKRPGQDMESWYGFSWPFGRRNREYSRPPLTLGKLQHGRQSSDHGLVDPVAQSGTKGKTAVLNGKGSPGATQGTNGKHRNKS
jgi:hypothetical protein